MQSLRMVWPVAVIALAGACGPNCARTASSAPRHGEPAPSAAEPRFDAAAGDTMIYHDDMDRYTTPQEMDRPRGCALRPYYPDQHPANYAVITGRGGTGRALRLVYERGGGERILWKTDPEDDNGWYRPAHAAFVLQYWFRISKKDRPGGGPGHSATDKGMKWVEFWRVGMRDRMQFGVTGGNAITGPLWHLARGSTGANLGFQPVPPYWNQVNDNQWHRVTYLYQPASAPGATDGVARMWLDGTKIVDVSAAAAGITPAGGTRVWTTMQEVAQLDDHQTGTINLGEYMNGTLGDGVTDLPMALDFDDFRWWKLSMRAR